MRSTELSEHDDATLVVRALDGGQDAFGELIRRHRRSALRLAAVISGSTEEADDIVQDAFVTIHARLGSYRGSGSVRSWILRVVANHAKNEVRSRARRRRRDDRHARLDVRAVDGADDVALDRVHHQALAAALGGLPARDRAVLGCRFVAGLSEAETAEVLDIARGTVKSRTSRALRRLERSLVRLDGGEDDR